MSEARLAIGWRVVITGWPGREEHARRSRSRPRPACRSSTLTSASGSPAGLRRRRPSGARSSDPCSLATRGSPTAISTRHSISGSNAPTLSSSSTCDGGCVQGARSYAGSGCREFVRGVRLLALGRLRDEWQLAGRIWRKRAVVASRDVRGRADGVRAVQADSIAAWSVRQRGSGGVVAAVLTHTAAPSAWIRMPV